MAKKTFVIRLTEIENKRIDDLRGDLKPTTFLQKMVSDSLLNKMDSYASSLDKIGQTEKNNSRMLNTILSKIDSTKTPVPASEQVSQKEIKEILSKLDTLIKNNSLELILRNVQNFRNSFSIFAQLNIENIAELKRADIPESDKVEMTKTFQNVKI